MGNKNRNTMSCRKPVRKKSDMIEEICMYSYERSQMKGLFMTCEGNCRFYIVFQQKVVYLGLSSEKLHVRNFVLSLFVYISATSDLPDEDIIQLVQDLPDPLKEIGMTTYDHFIERGKKQGKIEGKIEGKEENTIETILRLNNLGYSITEIVTITQRSEEYVLEVLRKYRDSQ